MAVILFTVSLRWVGWFLSPLPETSVLSLVSGQGLARGGRIHCPSFEGGLFFLSLFRTGSHLTQKLVPAADSSFLYEPRIQSMSRYPGCPRAVVTPHLVLTQSLELTHASPSILPSSPNLVRPFTRHQARTLSGLPLQPQAVLCAASGNLGEKSWWMDVESLCFWHSYWFKTAICSILNL